MPKTFVDIHVIQTVPPSNINRDDTGSPKTAVYGGQPRARVSSQAWKRATRDAFGSLLEDSEIGVRSKRVVELVAEQITVQDPSLEPRAEDLAARVLKAGGINTKQPRNKTKDSEAAPTPESDSLVFLSRHQIAGLAALAVQAAHQAGEGTPSFDQKEVKKRANTSHSVDISLFGRMVANAANLNVEASTQVAHALSVHAARTEFDYYTAVDDHKKAKEEEDAGAGMIGTIEFNSSTLYRYATIDVDELQGNLGDDDVTRRAVEAFTRAFISSMPSGKQNTFANRTLPDAVLVTVRDSQPINLVGAFEEPVGDHEEGGRIAASISRLARHGVELHEAFDERPVAGWSFGVGDRVAPLTQLGERSTFDTTVRSLGALVAGRMAEQS